MKKTIFSIIFVFLAFVQLASTKTLETSIPYSKLKKAGNSIYFSKFSLDLGTGSYKQKIKFNRPLYQANPNEYTNVSVGIIRDDSWDTFQYSETCEEKKKANYFTIDVSIPNDSKQWSEEKEQGLFQGARRRTYFFILYDCNENLAGKAPSNLKFEIEAQMFNIENSHFSSEEEGFLSSFFVILILCIFFFAKNVQRLVRQYKKEEEIDWPFLLANTALLCQIQNLFFEWIHMLIYSSNGQGSFILQLFGQLFGIASQFLMACIFVLISWGWTITFTQIDSFDLYIPLAVLMGIIHLMIMGLSKLTDDESHKYHQYGGAVGWILVAIRLGMFLYFLFGIKNTMKTAREKVKSFIVKFTAFGSAFFLAFPVILFISTFIAGYVQHRVITIGTLCIQSISMIIMSYMFTSKTSYYYQASVKSNPLLPTGKND